MIQRRPDLEPAFYPRSIAIVGASNQPGKPGHDYLEALLDLGFRGALYPVTPKEDYVLGLRAFPNVCAIPDPVDYVISCIPAPLVPSLMEDCVAKGVKIAHLYTAAFSETGEQERALLEAETLRIAQAGGVRIIGPNCMGIYCPESGLSFRYGQPKKSGPVALISQSGGYASTITFMSRARGLRFSKVVSYGNAVDLNECDFLEYCANDRQTRVIAAYIEGPRNGHRFLQLVREVSLQKPVVILKGGWTSAGSRAVASHTGSLAGQREIWESFFKQSGAIPVNSLEELVDVVLAFVHLGAPRGRRAGVVGGGGGGSVSAADDCERVGLPVPPMPPQIMAELHRLLPDAGISIGNPVDTSVVSRNRSAMPDVVRLVAGSEEVDLLVIDTGVDWMVGYRNGRDMLRLNVGMLIYTAGLFREKPAVFSLRSASIPHEWRDLLDELRDQILDAGFPVYENTARAANAISKLVQYYEWRAARV